MYGEFALDYSSRGGSEVAASIPPNFPKSTSLKIVSSTSQPLCEGNQLSANGLNGRRLVPPKRKDTPRRDGKDQNKDWLAAKISKRSVADVMDATGMSDKAVQNIRRKKNVISFDNLVDLCRSDEDFATDFFVYVGLLNPGEAETCAAVTKLINAYQRRQG